MDDGRETSVQTFKFLMLTCHSFKIFISISVSPSLILYQKVYSLSLKNSINLKDSEGRNFCILIRRRKTISPLKVDTVLMFKHDEFVAAILADIANKLRVEK